MNPSRSPRFLRRARAAGRVARRPSLAAAKTAPVAPPAAVAPPAPSAPGTSPIAPVLAAKAWLLIDMTSGQRLAGENDTARVDPASLTKLMVDYLTLAAIRDKKLTLTQAVPVPVDLYQRVNRRTESVMFIPPGKTATVDDLLHGLIIQSGQRRRAGAGRSGRRQRGELRRDDESRGEADGDERDQLPQSERHERSAALHDGGRPRDPRHAPDQRTSPSSTRSIRRRSSPTTASSRATATCCCGRTTPSTASRPATPTPPATA